MDINYFEMLSYVGSAFTLTAVLQKTMIPLRFFAICSNTVFIAYAYYKNIPAILIVQCILLPLNCFRLFQMRKLVRDVKASASGDLSMDWLLPYMSKTSFDKDLVLCRKGDTADSLYYLQEGQVHLPEIDTHLGPGSLIGEIGLFMPDSTRTTTIICSEDCVFMTIPADKVYELYHQNPEFGFYMIRIVTERLIQNVRRLEDSTAAQQPAPAQGT